MIQLLATHYQRHIAYALVLIFCSGLMIPSYAAGTKYKPVGSYSPASPVKRTSVATPIRQKKSSVAQPPVELAAVKTSAVEFVGTPERTIGKTKMDIDGPGQPEMSSFKSAGTNDMVNLFTGDFSYNIPLLDVGGYPVNIFYDGGVSMEQEASWVGLGWNINPGNINRNMRGVPDDFNGTEKLTQRQNMKPNKTWGVRIGADFEFGGKKDLFGFTFGADLGLSFNNYLGPAADFGIKGGVNVMVAAKGLPEKSAADSMTVKVGVGASVNTSSRYGVTMSPNISLTSKFFKGSNNLQSGLSLSTSYNSRAGIKGLQINEQLSFNRVQEEGRVYKDKHGNWAISDRPYQQSSSFHLSSGISFNKPTYIPAMRAVMTNSAVSGHFQFGIGAMLTFPSLETEVYFQESEIDPDDVKQVKPMVGYLNYNEAVNNKDAIMDFSRVNDNEVTPHTPVISAPQFAYDVFSIQGEGTGGSFRAYRNDFGYVKDKFTASKDRSNSIGVDVGWPSHYGGNFNTISTPSTMGEWNRGNKLKTLPGFTANSKATESVYFRSPGESSVLEDDQYASIGGTDIVRFKLGGTGNFPTVERTLQRLSPTNQVLEEIPVSSTVAARKKRTQVISYLTAGEASQVGLDKTILNYDPEVLLDENKNLRYGAINRVSAERLEHHISEINVTEADGKRYVYGLPVYNLSQTDMTFTINTDAGDKDLDKAEYEVTETDPLYSGHITGTTIKDGYVQTTVTPPYAHSFLLTGLLSPDYVDVKGDGITEDDMGGAVKFNYSKMADHIWRTPHTPDLHMSNMNAGNRSETKDDKGLVSGGVRESWYLHSIESKTMIAVFKLNETRQDGKGAEGILDGGVKSSDNSIRSLREIQLYNKADLKKNGVDAKPIKTVHFDYGYTLCAGTPDNTTEDGGKLTLQRIWFSYNGVTREKPGQYVFSYRGASEETGDNPSYSFASSDRWGNHKPASSLPDGLTHKDYPYAVQDKTIADQYSKSWALRRILLPSGGELEVQYESDDYAYVQNKRAAIMNNIIGFSKDSATAPTSNLYSLTGRSIIEHDVVFVKVPDECADRPAVFRKYLEGVNQLAFKLAVKMPKGTEYLLSYATIANYGVYSDAGFPAIWIRLNRVAGFSPLSLTAVEYLRENLPGQAFDGYDLSAEGQSMAQIGTALVIMLKNLKDAFKDVAYMLRRDRKAMETETGKCFVRLNDPDGFKYGGGHRVKTIKLKDNWDKMTQQYGSVFGQEYDYTTKEIFNGEERTISSGVASYEPSMGGEENPFQTVLQVANSLPLGPTSYGAIEMPMLDAFFPSPLVGYSKVTVTSIGKKQNTNPDKKTRSGVGRQVSEFYTAKDYPVTYGYTSLDPASDKQSHMNSFSAFLYKYAFDARALSQGFVVSVNDMHGKMKSQSSYAENDPNTRINYTENFYLNTGAKGLDQKFQFVSNTHSGLITEGNMGIDIELMTDTREFSTQSWSLEVQAQVDLVPWPPFALPFIWPVAGNSENTYRAVTTTKVINYHGVLDSVLVIDKGSQVSTKNLVYDAETGQVVVNRTNNEFDKAIYSVNYPAYWAYSGMGLAYKNIDAVFKDVDFVDGVIDDGMTEGEIKDIFESGDELYITDPGTASGCDAAMSVGGNIRLWAVNKNKQVGSLTDPDPDFVFVDKDGKPYSRKDVGFRIIRSGHRNMLGAPIASMTMLASPIVAVSADLKLVVNSYSNVLNASAVEYKEKWQTDPDLFRRINEEWNTTTCEEVVIDDCEGELEHWVNPYRKGLLGNFRGHLNKVFYGERKENDVAVSTNLPVNGHIKDFEPYWSFNGVSNMEPLGDPAKWKSSAEGLRYNAKGLQLETKDALQIHTAAQYGYQKSMPVAIANNSYSHEMFFDGFEDYSYAETLNGATYSTCEKRPLKFTGISGATVTTAGSESINAHTGQYVFKTTNEETSIPVTLIGAHPGNSFDIETSEEVLSSTLTDEGLNWIAGTSSGGTTTLTAYMPGGFKLNAHGWPIRTCLDLPNPCSGYTDAWSSTVSTQHYIEVTECRQYTIQTTNVPWAGAGTSTTGFSGFRIFDSDGDPVLMETTSCTSTIVHIPAPATVTNCTYTCTLSPGIYSVYARDMNGGYSKYCFAPQNSSCDIIPTDRDSVVTERNACFPYGDCVETASHPFKMFTVVGINKTAYKTLDADNCSMHVFKGEEDMLNDQFAIRKGDKMVFSAWVKELCGDPGSGIPCTKKTYTDNEVEVDFPGFTSNNVTIKPTGPIIEGWQRYEGFFTVPSGATAMNLVLRRTSNIEVMYFDDIRIHPFNSNMKSYVYDPVNMRLSSELDANNYASFYEYDEEGTLIRTKVETREGVKTVTESRSSKQKNIQEFD